MISEVDRVLVIIGFLLVFYCFLVLLSKSSKRKTREKLYLSGTYGYTVDKPCPKR